MSENVELHNTADYWQIALGGSSYTPKVHGKHVASHPKIVAQAMRIAGQRCPEVADVIAALVWKMILAENRASWVASMADEAATTHARTVEALRGAEKALAKIVYALCPDGQSFAVGEDAQDALRIANAALAKIKETP